MNIKVATSADDRQTAYKIRKIVFVEEQQVPIEIEIDDYEEESIHFICYDDGKAVGASRLRFSDDCGKLERICVLKANRGRSIGRQIIAQMEEEIVKNGSRTAKLNAQTHAIDFYEALGYKVVSEEFMDAGIPHKTMVKELNK